jgi:hypothetical protein
MPETYPSIKTSGTEKPWNNWLYIYFIFPTIEDRWVLTPRFVFLSILRHQSINPVITGFWSMLNVFLFLAARQILDIKILNN